MPPAPTWRRIETALIELLREEGFELEQVGGNTSITVYSAPPDEGSDHYHEINLGDFAKQLEERL